MKKIVLSVLCLGAVLAGCGGTKSSASPEGGEAREKVLNVYNWSGYIDPTVLEEFTKKTGIKVNYDVFDSNPGLETKICTGDPGKKNKKAEGEHEQRNRRPARTVSAVPDFGGCIPEAGQVQTAEPE